MTTLIVFLNGDEIEEPDEQGRPIHDDSFLRLMNGGADDVTVTLPGAPWARSWQAILDTGETTGQPRETGALHAAGESLVLPSRTLWLLKKVA